MIKYTIQIEYLQETKYCSAKPYEVVLETDRIEWSMEQYQRNRQPFKWKIIKEEQL
jgi:hypothetical protein|tara:strand:+ start:697 stop:864 length:168 start_codon:yes stop_codon:yes gene_type:complete